MTMTAEPVLKVLRCPTCNKLTVKMPSHLWRSKVADEVEVTCKAGHVYKIKQLRDTSP